MPSIMLLSSVFWLAFVHSAMAANRCPDGLLFSKNKSFVRSDVDLNVVDHVNDCSSRQRCGNGFGDCDAPNHCVEGLKCFHRVFGAGLPTGYEILLEEELWTDWDFCYDPEIKSSDDGEGICVSKCPSGMIPNHAEAECLQCPKEASTSVITSGSQVCEACGLGTVAVHGVCTQCLPGGFEGLVGSNSSFDPLSPCTPCPKGSHLHKLGYCAPCPSGTFSQGGDADACKPCPVSGSPPGKARSHPPPF